jgi:hypothetical protein
VTAAIALAVVLVIVVAGASMAMESQRSAQNPTARRTPGAPRPPRAAPSGGIGRRVRSRERDRGRPDPTSADAPPPPPAPVPEPESKPPDFLRTGEPAQAKVLSVVDERTIGPVTRSRLALRVEPSEGEPFEVTIRVAFQTPEQRGRVKVGSTVPVRYDRDDRSRVVVDLPPD